QLDIDGRQAFQRPYAESLDAQLPAERTNPAAAGEQAVAGALYMKNDLGRDLSRLGAGMPLCRRRRHCRRREGLLPTIEAAQVERRRGCGLSGLAVNSDHDVAPADWRAHDHGPASMFDPRAAPRTRRHELE